MKFLQRLSQEAADQRATIIVAAFIAGLAETSLLVIVGQTAARKIIGNPAPLLIGLFIVLIVVNVIAGLYLYRRTVQVAEGFIYRLRQRIAEKIRASELLALEQLDTDDALNCLTQETVALSQATNALGSALRAVFIAAFASLYLLAISIQGFLIWLGVIALIIFYFRQTLDDWASLDAQAAVQATAFFTGLGHLLDGFKQVKLERRAGDQLLREIDTASAAVYQLQGQGDRQFGVLNISNFSILYLGLAVLVFGLPQLLPTAPETLYQGVTAMLFILAPIASLLGALPGLTRADFATQRLLDLEQRLDQSTVFGRYGVIASTRAGIEFSGFETLKLARVEFHYPNEAGEQFKVGPLTLTIRVGEIIFIVGGNGSGKSTLINLLMGLYPPDSGEILIDDQPVTGSTLLDYRELFSAIYFNHHLFAKPYGLGALDPQMVNRLIKEMQIQQVTQFAGGRFSHLDLSSGQRKRLAMVVAMLEQRPVYVFDEWSAEQDPAFRAHFYEELLPQLHTQGKTIIAITHDDRYLDVADRVVKMELGQLVEDNGAGDPTNA